MPIPLLQAHLVMLPRIDAEEAIAEAERIAVGSGSMKPGSRTEVIAAWRRVAEVDVVRRPRDREAHRAALAAAHIGIRVVKRGATT
jgi:hypothetical protein